jgi:hypothetical protein
MKQNALLPGGIEVDGCLRREAVFQPLTGHIERQIESIHQHGLTTTKKVTETLSVCLDSLGGKKVDGTLVEKLCIADRQFLMLCLSVRLKGTQLWIHPTCSACHATFDLFIDKMMLPVVPANDHYPRTTVDINGRIFNLRSPTGHDLAELELLGDEAGIRQLAYRCIEQVDGQPPEKAVIDGLNQVDIEKIELALEEISPSVCTEVETDCPECNSRQHVELNFNNFASTNSSNNLMIETHRIAEHYHWSEHEILALPKERRQGYLKLIDTSEGRYS